MIKNLYYELIGSVDPAIVFLHGWGMNGSSFDGLISKLSGDQKILNIDFFSFGKSDQVEEWFDTYEYAYHVFLLLKQINLKKVILVGHSFGGRIAMILSSVFDIDVVHIVLTSSAGLIKFNLIKKIKIYYYKFVKYLVRKKIVPDKTLSKFGSDDYKKLDDCLRKVFVRVVNQDLKYLLRLIYCKSTLIWDKKDDITPNWICKKLNKGLNSQNVIYFENGKHYAYLYNIEKFVKIIINIINDTKYIDNDI